MPLPPMVSHAQNAEDVVLRRVFPVATDGFYVDVGACVPDEDSVTLHFYQRGWRGVNVEPDPQFHQALQRARPRDVNVHAAVGRSRDAVTFYPTGTRGQGTLDERLAVDRGAAEPLQVPQVPLADLLAEHAPTVPVDFLKVDVEGWEEQVLASADWSAVRPRIVVVEAVDPGGSPTHQHWEPLLLQAGYRFGLFDGLNRFYCRDEDAEELLPRLSIPANVLDNWRSAREVAVQAALQEEVERREAQLGGLRGALEEAVEVQARQSALKDELAAVQAAVVRLQQVLDTEQAAHAGTRGRLEAQQAVCAELTAALAQEKAARVQVEQALSGMLASTSWRLTSPVRDASRMAKLLRKGSSA